MSSQVFALKYRPQDFEGVVGQEVTVQILKNALTDKRFHHAYLFTGPRGVGKTSLARIFAKTLNCQEGPTPVPCDRCSSCQEITEGRSLSVLEIDGASNTSVEDVREIREKIQYLPPGGRYKIYIIDEVHMLSTAAFNALLKTLEEPPPHALFLFATTDPQKVPVTVLSRVIRFDLRPIRFQQIIDQLKKITKEESIKINEGALFQIAREAQGGLRDALSLLDQIHSLSGEEITESTVEEVIGLSTRKFIFELSQAILNREGSKGLQVSESAFAAGVDTKRFALDLLEHFRHLLVAQVSQDTALFNLPIETVEELVVQSKPVSPEDLDRLFRMIQKGVTDLLRAPLPKVLFDVLLLRLCHYDRLRSIDEILKTINVEDNGLSSCGDPAVSTGLPRRPLETPRNDKVDVPKEAKKDWPSFLSFLQRKKPQLAPMVEQGHVAHLDEMEVILQYPPDSIYVSLLKDPDREKGFQSLLTEFFGHSLRVLYQGEAPKKEPPKKEVPKIEKKEAPEVEKKVETMNAGIIDEAMSIFGEATKVVSSVKESQ